MPPRKGVKPTQAQLNAREHLKERRSLQQYQADLKLNMTDQEAVIREDLEKMGFEFQVIFAGRIVDFYHHKKMIAVEVDGGHHYKNGRLTLKDTRRDRWLEKNGVKRVVHVPNHEIDSCPKAFVDDIRDILKDSTAHEWRDSVKLTPCFVGTPVKRPLKVKRKFSNAFSKKLFAISEKRASRLRRIG
jgi:very-short-patch-repair endonuclease